MTRNLESEIQHAALRQLYFYWLGKKSGRMAPSRADIEPAEMKAFLRHVFLLDVVGAPPRFRFRLVGTEVVSRYGEELTGRFLDEIDLDDVGIDIVGEYQRAFREARPVRGHWAYEKRSGHYLKYERLILPLSSDGSSIDMLLCGAQIDGPPAGYDSKEGDSGPPIVKVI